MKLKEGQRIIEVDINVDYDDDSAFWIQKLRGRKRMPVTDATEILPVSRHYSELLDSFSTEKRLQPDLQSREISEAMFFHICKMRYAGWRHRINFGRGRKHSLSEFFQDIVAFYLGVSLPGEYTVELETKRGRIQPDIAIRRNGEYCFLIEVKTNIGFERPDRNAVDPWRKMSDRVAALSKSFSVKQENIIHVFGTRLSTGSAESSNPVTAARPKRWFLFPSVSPRLTVRHKDRRTFFSTG